MPAHVRKGDTVMITSGAHKGKTGEIMRVDPTNQRVIIKGLNLRTKHLKPTRINPQGGIITKEASIHLSNLALEDPKDGKPTRVGFKTLEDGRKVRIAKRSGEVISEKR